VFHVSSALSVPAKCTVALYPVDDRSQNPIATVHIGGLFSDPDARRVGVAGYEAPHDRGIGDAKAIDSAQNS
jgi:hypothetical protein